MKRNLALLTLAGVAASSMTGGSAVGAEAAICSRERVAAAGAAVRAARSELMAIPLEADGTLVPPATSSRIERVKDRVRILVRAEMACTTASPAPAMLAATLTGGGHGLAVTVPREPLTLSEHHGDGLSYRVARVESHPDMLAVVATLEIKCGSDSMLILYRRTPAGWRELMVRRAEPYREVKGGWQDLRFAVSPADAQGRWFVATVSTTPWCSSAWQSMRFALARPSEEPGRPHVFFDDRTTTFLGGEDELLLRAERDAFELRHVAGSIDPAVHNRRHVRRYAVSGDILRRVPPVADSVRDFIDEWIVSPWTEAKDWSGPDPELARLHARLHPNHYRQLDEFVSIRACDGGLTQVEIGADEGPSWFFLVRDHRQSPWIMERMGRRAAADCSGPNLLGKD